MWIKLGHIHYNLNKVRSFRQVAQGRYADLILEYDDGQTELIPDYDRTLYQQVCRLTSQKDATE